jgi:hypothetical protein
MITGMVFGSRCDLAIHHWKKKQDMIAMHVPPMNDSTSQEQADPYSVKHEEMPLRAVYYLLPRTTVDGPGT